MKICFLNHDLSDKTGAGRFCLSLLQALKEIAPNNEYGVLTHDDALPIGVLRSVLSLGRLRKVFKGFDIIHALDGWPYGFLAVLGARGLGKRVVITAVGTGAVQPLYRPIRGRLLRWAYKNADVVTAISNNTKREVLKKVPGLNIKVVNHGVDYKKFKDTNLKKSALSAPYILSVGTLKKRKGYEYSIRAYARAVKKFPELKYIVVGTGEERENLELSIKNLELDDKIIFLDGLDEKELIGLFHNAELFILLPQNVDYDIEGFGLVFLEAAATGLPVVATKNSSAEDAVLDGQNGILVSQKNHLAAGEAIEKILSDKKLKEKFSARSQEFAREMSWQKAAGEYLSIW